MKLISFLVLILLARLLTGCSVTLGLDVTDPKTGNVAKIGFNGELPDSKGLKK